MKHYQVLYQELSSGETLAYRKAGDHGPTLLLVHGNMSSSIFFEQTMNELEDSYLVVAVDLKGFGDSTYTKEADSLRDFAEDLALFVEALKLKSVTVLGWSTGGGIALELSVLKPEVIKKVILLDSVGVKGFPMFQKDAKGQLLLDKPHVSKKTIAQDAVQVAPVLSAYANQDAATMKAIWNTLIYNLKQPAEDVYDLHIEAMFKQRNLVDVDYALMVFNMTNEHSGFAEGSNRLKDIQADVLILHGAKDLVVPLSFAQQTKSFLKDKAQLVVFDHTGHSLITDDFELFIKTLREHVI
jgi:2-hydroxy-6-oxonona-2,4-dienedioate hydrolase